MKKACLLPVLFCLCGLSACGDGKSDQEEIVTAINYALVSTAPDACTEARTQAFSEQMFRIEGAEAVESCEQNARGEESPNDPVKVTNVEVEGSRATAEVGLTEDGKVTGQALAMGLIEEGGSWKLDEITGFAEFHPRQWVEEEREALEKSETLGEPQFVDCMVETFREMSRSELEEMRLGGSAQPELEIIDRCTSGKPGIPGD